MEMNIFEHSYAEHAVTLEEKQFINFDKKAVFSKWPMSKCYKEGQLAVSQVTAGVQLL
jgi:hypothetical protein